MSNTSVKPPRTCRACGATLLLTDRACSGCGRLAGLIPPPIPGRQPAAPLVPASPPPQTLNYHAPYKPTHPSPSTTSKATWVGISMLILIAIFRFVLAMMHASR